ncbi:phage portal protein [Clostridium botulinum]|nr:phage portal protein [Clostridium botulinum]NFN20794.1 phage portal protein [Clostridium botulinum]NFN42012.1 phage portal protein [Clostridium botulinum]
MNIKELMTRSLETFLRLGSDTNSVELDNETMAMLDDLNEDGVTDFKIENVPLTREVAMKITALNEGINQISDSISALPVYLYKREDDGSRQKVKDKRNKLLNLENSKHSTSYNMKKNLIMDFLFYGNGYLDINRDVKNEIISLMHIPYKEVQLIDVNSINKRDAEYQYSYWGMTNEFHEVLNLVRNPYRDQLKGIGVLEEGSMALEGATGLDEYSKNVINTGFNARGVIESEKIMSKPSRQSLTAMLKRFFSGGKNSGKILILDDGMKFKGLSLSPADMNLLQQKSFTVEDIARLLKMPSYMLGASGSSMVYSNVEQTQLMFLQMTIDPILRLIEDTFNKYLLTEDEKESGFFFEFSTQNMLRTTPEKEILMYANAVKGSLLTVNEARRKMNWNYLKGMDRPIVMSGTCTINENGEVVGVNNMPPKGGEENK